MDEAASRLRLQQESKPETLENLDRQIITLKIELSALQKETDIRSRERREKVEKEIVKKEAEARLLSQQYKEEK